MAEKRPVIWSLESARKIESIKSYVHEEWSEVEVKQFLITLKKFEELVSRFPKLYPASLKYPELRKAVISKHQSVIYEITDEKRIQVITILDHRQSH